jgi:DNA-binding MarR family transcriptional regulator
MPKRRNIARAVERRIIGELLIGAMVNMRRAYFPTLPPQNVPDLGLVMAYVMLAHIAGHTTTAHKIAEETAIPRATITRRLALLERLGHLERRGSRYLMSARAAAEPPSESALDALVQLIIKAGRDLERAKLSKMSSKTVDAA